MSVNEVCVMSVKVTVPPGAIVTGTLIAPEPLAAQLEPADATQLHAADKTPPAIGKVVGSASVTVTPLAVLGPVLVKVMMYAGAAPALIVAAESVLVRVTATEAV